MYQNFIGRRYVVNPSEATEERTRLIFGVDVSIDVVDIERWGEVNGIEKLDLG